MQFALPDRLLYCFDREGWRVGFSNLELLANLPNRTLQTPSIASPTT